MRYTDCIEFEPREEIVNIIIEPVCYNYEIKPGEKINIVGESNVEGKFQTRSTGFVILRFK